jgi:hypothetical protein
MTSSETRALRHAALLVLGLGFLRATVGCSGFRGSAQSWLNAFSHYDRTLGDSWDWRILNQSAESALPRLNGLGPS